MLETWRRYRQAQIAQRELSLEDELRKLDGKIEQLKWMDRLVETDSDSMVKTYETRIKKLENRQGRSGREIRSIAASDAFMRCRT